MVGEDIDLGEDISLTFVYNLKLAPYERKFEIFYLQPEYPPLL